MYRCIEFMMHFKDIFSALILILPAYVANGTPVILSKILKKTHPIDMGMLFVDKRRVLGDGKTIEGFLSGVLAGTATGYLLESSNMHTVMGSFLLAFGAMTGDTLGSFIKRRLGFERGELAPILDQLDFVVGALVLYHTFEELECSLVFIILVITPLLHLATNYLAYRLGLKKEPW